VIGDILQPTHLLFVLVIALLVLGPKRLPEVGRSLGRGLRDFRNAISGEDHHDETLTQTTAEEPVHPAPELVNPVPEPVKPTPEPVKPTPEPVKPTPEPAEHVGSGAASGQP
jgi:sec-independent protein translocase protein TatA